MKHKVSSLSDSQLLFVISKCIFCILFFFYPLSIGVLSNKCRALASRNREYSCYMKTVSNCFSIYPLCQTSREIHSRCGCGSGSSWKRGQHTVFMETAYEIMQTAFAFGFCVGKTNSLSKRYFFLDLTFRLWWLSLRRQVHLKLYNLITLQLFENRS